MKKTLFFPFIALLVLGALALLQLVNHEEETQPPSGRGGEGGGFAGLYVINLARCPEKKARMAQVLQGVPHTVWEAYDAREHPVTEVCRETDLQGGEVACTESHIRVLTHAAEVHHPDDWVVVLEDDAEADPGEEIQTMVSQALAETTQTGLSQEDPLVVLLGWTNGVKMTRSITQATPRLWRCGRGACVDVHATFAYAVRARDAPLLARHWRDVQCRHPLDWWWRAPLTVLLATKKPLPLTQFFRRESPGALFRQDRRESTVRT